MYTYNGAILQMLLLCNFQYGVSPNILDTFIQYGKVGTVMLCLVFILNSYWISRRAVALTLETKNKKLLHYSTPTGYISVYK
jgi:hypothetical protein